MPIDLRLDPAEIALCTDLYELTVSAAFFEHAMNQPAAFEMALRRMPPDRGYLIAAGAERLIEALESYRFDTAALEYLASLGIFKPPFLDYLAGFRFSGEVRAMPEGTVFFAGEPIFEIYAPLVEGQIVETLVLNQLGFAAMAATKAARCVGVAAGRRLVDFGGRRAQGADAALIAARSSYIAGFAGSASVLAGRRYGIPVFGTMSHSFVMAHENERAAFDNFAASFSAPATILVDTYDTLRGVENAAAVGERLRASGAKLAGIRLDSGNLQSLAMQARKILDRHGLNETAIFASGNLDEYRIAELLAARAPIDAFGVGSALAVSDDAPAGDFTYKLVEYQGHPRLKLSAGKASTPGRKQIFRACSATGQYTGDLLGAIDESAATVARVLKTPPAQIHPLLEVQMERGVRVMPRPGLAEIRARTAAGLAKLDPRYRMLRRPSTYPVRQSAAINAMTITEKVRAEHRQD
ncbi:MAG TPA: nicotinate phosphoribosyltransferase [Candidatus Binataceae bacterium]|nr:nicotinate phosphoribosyltransferase [Candidatus Binataceae bacterium]